MVNKPREYREANLVDAIETGAGILTEAIGGTLMMAQVVSGPALQSAHSKETETQHFGPGPERMG